MDAPIVFSLTASELEEMGLALGGGGYGSIAGGPPAPCYSSIINLKTGKSVFERWWDHRNGDHGWKYVAEKD